MKKFLRALKPQVISEADFPPGVRARRNARARRLSLRLDIYARCVVLNIPRRTSMKKAREFALDHSIWIARKLRELPTPIPFMDGSVIPFFGVEHKILHQGTRARQPVTAENGTISVHGDAAHINRRVRDFLIAQARQNLHEMTRAKAALAGKTVKKLTVRDTKTRWGSCSANGEISLSWRLVFAPQFVTDYIVAHEVAHLEFMHHKKSFWKLCDSLCEDGAGARLWLRKNGQSLHRYGQQDGTSPSRTPLNLFSGNGQKA